jgi:hypothetical protein
MSEGAGGAWPRTPELPVDPRLPGEPTVSEVAKTQDWLAKRGVRVSRPTRLLAIRIGARRSARAGGLKLPFAFIVLGFFGAIAYQCLQYLPHVRGVEMTESKFVYFLLISARSAPGSRCGWRSTTSCGSRTLIS